MGSKLIIELSNLSDWKKQEEILNELFCNYNISISSREWRNAVNRWNKKFLSGDVDYYITHSNSKGFKATINYEEAKIGRNDYIKRALNMLKKARECDKAFGVKDNYKFDFDNEGEIK